MKIAVLFASTTQRGRVLIPSAALPPLRQPWIEERGDTEEHDGRVATMRDDGRAAVRRAGSNRSLSAEVWPGSWRQPRRAHAGSTVTQLHYARRGDITPEMEFIALRESVEAEFVRDEIASGRAILPANINHPESEPMVIGRTAS